MTNTMMETPNWNEHMHSRTLPWDMRDFSLPISPCRSSHAGGNSLIWDLFTTCVQSLNLLTIPTRQGDAEACICELQDTFQEAVHRQ